MLLVLSAPMAQEGTVEFDELTHTDVATLNDIGVGNWLDKLGMPLNGGARTRFRRLEQEWKY